MAELDPSFLQNICRSPLGDRLVLANLVCGEGVIGDGLAVTTSGADGSVIVGDGGGFVQGDDVPDQGMYSIGMDDPELKSITANSSGDPRIDRIVAQVYDSAYGALSDGWLAQPIAGTPTPGADLTNLTGAAPEPDDAITLAYVLVPDGFTPSSTVGAGNILDARTRFASCAGKMTDYDPALSGFTISDGTFRWGRVGDLITVEFFFTVATSVGTWLMDLPTPARDPGGVPRVSFGSMLFYDDDAGGLSSGLVVLISGTTSLEQVAFLDIGTETIYDASGQDVGDTMGGTFTYEAAT